MDESTYSVANNSRPQMYFLHFRDAGQIKCLEEMESTVLDRVGTLPNLNYHVSNNRLTPAIFHPSLKVSFSVCFPFIYFSCGILSFQKPWSSSIYCMLMFFVRKYLLSLFSETLYTDTFSSKSSVHYFASQKR